MRYGLTAGAGKVLADYVTHALRDLGRPFRTRFGDPTVEIHQYPDRHEDVLVIRIPIRPLGAMEL